MWAKKERPLSLGRGCGGPQLVSASASYTSTSTCEGSHRDLRVKQRNPNPNLNTSQINQINQSAPETMRGHNPRIITYALIRELVGLLSRLPRMFQVSMISYSQQGASAGLAFASF